MAAASPLAETLSEKFEALFPTWTTIVATILALLIILFFLTKFLYKPVKKMHDDRVNYIQNNINEAEKLRKVAVLDRVKLETELQASSINARKIIENAERQAEEIKRQVLAKTNLDAQKVLANAENEIKAQWNKFAEESKAAIVTLSLEAASKVIEKEVDNSINQKIVKDFIGNKKKV